VISTRIGDVIVSNAETHTIKHGGRETFLLSRYRSPLGTYIVVSSQEGIVCLATEPEVNARLRLWESGGIQIQEGGHHNEALAREMDEYFAGRIRRFTVPLDLRGTPFQRQVWQELRRIPYGSTRSYGQVARALGRPSVARAVGQANHRNPIAIVVPCHRVIGTDGKLTGYAGGLDIKRALLDLEAATLRQSAT